MRRHHLGWPIAVAMAMAAGFSAACSSDAPDPDSGGTGGASTGGKGSGGANTGGTSTGGKSTGGANTGGSAGEPVEGGVEACDPDAPVPAGLSFTLSPDPDGDASSGDPEPPQFGKVSIEVAGTLTAVERTPSDGLRLEIATSDAGASARTFEIASATALQWYDPLRAALNRPVTLLVRKAKGFQFNTSRGFVLSDADGTLMAYQGGPYVAAIGPSDYPGITVSRGEDICALTTSCEDLVRTELVFRGDTETSVGKGLDGNFLLDGRLFRARTLGAARIVESRCTDLERTDTWLFWRLRVPQPVDAGPG